MLGRLLALGTAAAMMGDVMGTTHVINVGRGNHQFEPRQVTAEPGDIVSFHFYPANHSVVRMDPEIPCFPWEAYNTEGQGWWSHFWPLSTSPADNNPVKYDLLINDTDPQYFYCSAPESCIKYQMVGAINPPNDTYIDTVAAKAAIAPYALSPGEPFRSEDGSTASSTSSSSSSSSTPDNDNDNDNGHVVLSPGAIAGIAIGGVIALALIGLLFFFVGRKKKGAEMKEANAAVTSPEDGLMGGEHPPVYQDPRYSVGVAGAAGHWDAKNSGAVQQQQPMSEHPNRISELPSQAYDPVEIYTPGPEDMPAHRR